MFRPELELAKLSILEDGWTQPIVAGRDGEIIDGFHRWHLAKTDAEVRARADGLIPVVRLDGERERRMLSTVRHNRARGQHGVLRLGQLLRSVIARYGEAAGRRLGMDSEEVERLTEMRGNPELAGKDSFGRGWVPLPKGRGKA